MLQIHRYGNSRIVDGGGDSALAMLITLAFVIHWILVGAIAAYSLAFMGAGWVLVAVGLVAYLFFFVFVIARIVRHLYRFPIPSLLTELIDNPHRRRFIQKPDEIAARMELEPGFTVVEIGPGKGSYTKAVAKRVIPGGKVFAVDISEEVIAKLKARVEREGIPNIIPKIDDAYNFSFADGSVDRVFAIACLPEIPDQVRALKECRRILKPGGIVSLCELAPDADFPLRRTEKRWARQAGLELKGEFGNALVYQLNFWKKP